MPLTHTHDFSPILLHSLSTTPFSLIFPMFPDLHNWPYSALPLLNLGRSPIIRCSPRANRNWSAILQFLPVSHINPRFPQMGHSDCYLCHAVSCLAYSLTLKMGGDVALQNVGWLLMDNTALYPRRYNSSACLD
jgi:hypothetical protein